MRGEDAPHWVQLGFGKVKHFSSTKFQPGQQRRDSVLRPAPPPPRPSHLANLTLTWPEGHRRPSSPCRTLAAFQRVWRGLRYLIYFKHCCQRFLCRPSLTPKWHRSRTLESDTQRGWRAKAQGGWSARQGTPLRRQGTTGKRRTQMTPGLLRRWRFALAVLAEVVAPMRICVYWKRVLERQHSPLLFLSNHHRELCTSFRVLVAPTQNRWRLTVQADWLGHYWQGVQQDAKGMATHAEDRLILEQVLFL